MIRRSIDFYGPDGKMAVVYSAAARGGRRIELGLQVWNTKSALWEKRLCTQLLPDDLVGICFELQRLYDKAQAAGFTLRDMGKEVTA